MKNTLENKAKFFAQYWGQKVMIDTTIDERIFPFTTGNIEYNIGVAYLQLKPLTSISDEDAKILGYADAKSATTTYIKSIGAYADDADYLRSKGYALPWMGLSVEKQIEYSWIKF